MQGVSLWNDKGQQVLQPETATAMFLGEIIVPPGLKRWDEHRVSLTAPPGVDFTKNPPYIIALDVPDMNQSSRDVRGSVVFSGTYPYKLRLSAPLLFHEVLNTTATSCTIVFYAIYDITKPWKYAYGVSG